MTCCKEIPIPTLKIFPSEISRLNFFYNNAKRKVFQNRYNLSNWFSLSFVDNEVESSIIKNFPNIDEWFTMLKKSDLKGVKECYLSVLEAKTSIPWHKDLSEDVFSEAFLTSISTDKSFIEFRNDKKYTYKPGHSYVIRSAIDHRILNLSDANRFTLCTIPLENPYV